MGGIFVQIKWLCALISVGSVCAWMACAAPYAAAATLEITEPFKGIRHIHRTTTLPRQLDMHVLEVDMAAPGLEFKVTPSNYSAPGETNAQTTRAFLTQHGAQAAINGAFTAYVSGNYMEVQGLAVDKGFVYSTFQEHRLEALNITPDNVATVIKSLYGTGIAHSPATQLYNVIGGDARLVTNGMNTANPADESLHPRTAVGVTADGRLLMLTVDGRNIGHSRGVSTPELADILIHLGARDAINLDGGGSTTMVFADPTPRVVNIPVGINNQPGTERAVGSNLAVFAQPNTAGHNTMVFADFEFGDEGNFGYSLTTSGSTSGILPSSTATADFGAGRNGGWGQRLTILDDPATVGSGDNPTGWFVRHLSGNPGAGSPGNRAANTPRPTTGSVGFWAKTTASDLKVALAIDSTTGVTADRGVRLPLIADGKWHRYAWNLDDDSQWEGWFNGDGIINSVDFTLDSIQLFGANASATVWIDDVFHETAPVAAADFNIDGVVDVMDLKRWASATAMSSEADANGDGASDGKDFLVWQQQVNRGPQFTGFGSTIPEPPAYVPGLAAWAALVALHDRFCRRRTSR